MATKRERQDAKLLQAGLDRAARNVIEPGRYAVGDNNTNNAVDNPNIGGLLPGRPWA